MNETAQQYLTTRELADLLRIKERKVYDMATRGEVPCIRIVGKLLFPRQEIFGWIQSAHSGPIVEQAAPLPGIVVGSHDPLLEWALRESGSGLASRCDGSRDGLLRMQQGEGIICGTHLHESNGWNVSAVEHTLGGQAVVLVEFARRSRGLIVAGDNPMKIDSLSQMQSLRVASRQAGAASQQLFEHLVGAEGIDITTLNYASEIARTEDELGMLVFEQKADAAFGLESVARRLNLSFCPIMQERFDLLVWRRSWFETPFQRLLAFFDSDAFVQKAESLGGYDVSQLGFVQYNG